MLAAGQHRLFRLMHGRSVIEIAADDDMRNYVNELLAARGVFVEPTAIPWQSMFVWRMKDDVTCERPI
jgi:hypothetical protein